jgi:hypothetical protein
MAIVEHIPKKSSIKDNRKPEGGYYVAKCEVCGVTYYPSRPTSKYCSSNCSITAYRRRITEGTVKTVKKHKNTTGKSKSIDEDGILFSGSKKAMVKWMKDKYGHLMGTSDDILKKLSIWEDVSFTDDDDNEIYITRISEKKYEAEQR